MARKSYARSTLPVAKSGEFGETVTAHWLERVIDIDVKHLAKAWLVQEGAEIRSRVAVPAGQRGGGGGESEVQRPVRSRRASQIRLAGSAHLASRPRRLHALLPASAA